MPLPVLTPAPALAGGLPVGGRLALGPGGELRLLELLADDVRTFSPAEPATRELPLPRTCDSLLDVERKVEEAWEEQGMFRGGRPSLGTDLLDLQLLPAAAPLASLNTSGFSRVEVGLSPLSRDLKLP